LASKHTTSEAQINSLILDKLGLQLTDIEGVPSGEISETYFISTDSEQLVLRIAHPKLRDTLYKDHYVSTCLVSKSVPVAEFVQLGDFEGGTYCVSRRAEGVILTDLDQETFAGLVPTLVDTLDEIHHSDITDTSGFGSFDRNGEGRFSSWHEYLLAVGLEETQEPGFYGRWYKLFDEGILERDLFFRLYDELKERVLDIPPVRSLVHADYGFDNVLATPHRVTAVIDWANACFGDHLFDVARMQMLQPEWQFEQHFRERYSARGEELPGYANRLWCYYVYMLLDGMRFYAQTRQPDGYKWLVDKAVMAGLIKADQT